ncbi:MAG: zinc metalloprotease HtpX [bacterium]|nr:zinc metalloprotease HtpX [bacterium]MDT8365849.1 zinc metalloprotease HtpX [bacterium]
MNNVLKTTFLLGALTGILLLFGQVFGGRTGMIIAFGFAIVMNFGSYWFSDRIVLALYRAKPINESDDPELYSIVRNLATRAGLPMPKVCRIPQAAPNAFATGRNPENAVVAVTDGIRSLLTPEELSGVIGHELAHIGHRDILISSIAATLAGAIMMLASMAKWAFIFGGGRDNDNNPLGALLMAILAPIAAIIIQMAVSRSREYQADQTGARIAGNPDSLASALEKLALASKRVPMAASQATSHMFIVRPFTGRSMLNLFSTHPPVEKRVERLREMKRTG